ncbi:RAD55 family ATPase [Polyangium aurulentum]|uniref:RAD55 family ATPase n=1 Tax=Polyangium aurulentum TaxID=2567896 RepID=UPI0010AE930F|nr:ATPase domain-containing protein [Polyangium aurulentum]UQA55679.1 AAA family ATPase [Polyangium aurulentum]
MRQDEQDRTPIERIPSGIPGLDAVLNGGFLSGSVQLLMGPPGSGKTILANQIAFNRAAAGHSAVYVTLLAEAHARMLAHMRSFEFFDASVVPRRIVYMSGYGVLEQGGLDSLLELLGRTIREHSATLLVIDGLATTEEFAPTTSAFKKFLLTLSTSASLTGCTTLLLTVGEEYGRTRAEYATVDGLLLLDRRRAGARSVREVSICKMRGTNYLLGAHSFAIKASGMHVFPRLEACIDALPTPRLPSEPDTRLGFEVPGLDDMLGGGLPRGTATALIGPSGAGKTLLGLSFLAAGAYRNERGIYLGFHEPPPRLVRSAEGIGLRITDLVTRGDIRLLWQLAGESLIDELAGKLLDAVTGPGQKRLFIDGLDGFRNASTEPDRLERFLAALMAELASRDVTTILSDTVSTGDLDTGTLGSMPSTFLDNIVVLRRAERERRSRRYVTALKLHGCGPDPTARRMQISNSGLTVSHSLRAAFRRKGGA